MSKFKLVQTCGGCPEQYDVYKDICKVGYLRLRHGYFTTECCGETVYSADTIGDGIFEDNERRFHLNRACEAISERLERKDKDEEEALYELCLEEDIK